MTSPVDVHAHVASRPALAEMRTIHPEVIPELDESGGDTLLLRYRSGVVNGPVPVGLVDPEMRVADMDRTGIDHQVLSTRPQMFTYDLPGELAASLASIANNALVALSHEHPDRFSVLISLPMQDPERTLAEIDRLGGDRSVRGAFVDSNLAGRNLDGSAQSRSCWGATVRSTWGSVTRRARFVPTVCPLAKRRPSCQTRANDS